MYFEVLQRKFELKWKNLVGWGGNFFTKQAEDIYVIKCKVMFLTINSESFVYIKEQWGRYP